jgi:L-asparaginase II
MPPRLTPGVPLIEVTRRDAGARGADVVESVHSGHLVVVGPDAEVVAALGDPSVVTFVRSTVKPIQATACLELLAPEDRPAGAALAVTWASHRGEAYHLEAVEAVLAASGTSAEALTCPPAVAEASPGRAPTRLQHNCSGKHALFALAGATLGVRGPALLDPDGPLQRVVLAELAGLLGPSPHLGVDGCGAPAMMAPLLALARAYLAVTGAERFAAVREAGIAAPLLVGGTGRAESALLAAGVVAKPGAEGVFAAGWHGPDGPYALALKVSDGAGRAAAAAAAAVVAGAGAVHPETWTPPPPLGGGRPQGVLRPSRELAVLLTHLPSRAPA